MFADGHSFYLRAALVVVGLIFIFGVYPLLNMWPSGWAWGHGHSHYAMMIIGIYVTLGVFLLLASRDPDAHRTSPTRWPRSSGSANACTAMMTPCTTLDQTVNQIRLADHPTASRM
jgi:hypothetical protein